MTMMVMIMMMVIMMKSLITTGLIYFTYLLWLFSLLDILVSHLKVVDVLFLRIF